MKKNKKEKSKKDRKSQILIVKRKGHTEPYDERKVYASCYFACRNAHLGEKESEKICEKVCVAVTRNVSKKNFVTSDQIFRILVEELKKHEEDAAFLYETHRDIS